MMMSTCTAVPGVDEEIVHHLLAVVHDVAAQVEIEIQV
jgi:hypothetical protein